ncbi:MAG: hypothetical protein WCO23_03120 [bacterium]
MIFEEKYFQKLKFTDEQISQFYHSSLHDLKIAKEISIPDVIFKFSYDALIKIGIALIASKNYKVRSNAGHHIKIIEKLATILQDNDINLLGNKMRQDRNSNLYDGSYFVSEKDSKEYLQFVKKVFNQAKGQL